ncbi:MAG: hypothetical protein Q9180_002644 [Flavoplaca navasiana]
MPSTCVLDPTCIFLPNSTADVSAAVALYSQHGCTFSIKGRGHSTGPGAANVDDGVLMNMRNMDDITLNQNQSNVVVGPGNSLGDVYRALDPYNVSVVIGRYDSVGFGLMVAAGLSFFNNRDGLAIDNVESYEVVIANGTVLHTSLSSHPDLHWALKGGNNNFGVVTHYTLRAFKNPGGVYGGLVTYPESSLDRLNDVIYDYHTKGAVDDVLTHVLPEYGYNGTSNETTNFSPVVYNALVNSLPPSLSGWIDTPHTNSTLRLTKYADLVEEFNAGYPDGLVQEQRVFTVYADRQFFADVWSLFRQWMQKYRHIEGFYGLHCNMPITPHAIAQGYANGGNALGLESSENRTLSVLYFGITFNNLEDRDRVLPAHDIFVNSMRALAAERGLLNRYIMLPYAGFDQPVFEGYGDANVARLQRIRAMYDPSFVFQRLVTGGHKVPLT